MADSSPTAPRPADTTLIPQGEHLGKASMPLGHHPFTLIGSRNRAHLHLLSSTVSRSHACIINTATGMYVRDLGSRSGVLLNSRKIKESDLQDGDLLQVGSFTFRFTESLGVFHQKRPRVAPPAMLEVGPGKTPIDGRTLLIGRRPNCDIPLDTASVSSTHAVIFECDGKRYVRDLGSRTGTLVNGQAVHQQVLEFGDKVRIGETTFRYIAAEEVHEEVAAVKETVPAAMELERQDPGTEDSGPIGLHFDNDDSIVGHAQEPEPLLPAIEEDQIDLAPSDAPAAATAPAPEPIEEFDLAGETRVPQTDLTPPESDRILTAPIAAEPEDDLGLDFWTPETTAGATTSAASAAVEEAAETLPLEPSPEPPAPAAEVPEANESADDFEQFVVEPQPVAEEPPIAIDDAPLETVEPESISVELEPAAVEPELHPEPEPLAFESEPETKPESAPVTAAAVVEPELPTLEPELAAVAEEPEAVSVEPESTWEPELVEPIGSEPEPELEPDLIEPIAAEPEPPPAVESISEPEEPIAPPAVVEETAPAALRVEDIDLSAVSFTPEPSTDSADVIDESPSSVPAPLLDLVPPVAPVVAETAAIATVIAEVAATEPAVPPPKTKKPRKAPGGRSRKKKATEEADEPVVSSSSSDAEVPATGFTTDTVGAVPVEPEVTTTAETPAPAPVVEPTPVETIAEVPQPPEPEPQAIEPEVATPVEEAQEAEDVWQPIVPLDEAPAGEVLFDATASAGALTPADKIAPAPEIEQLVAPVSETLAPTEPLVPEPEPVAAFEPPAIELAEPPNEPLVAAVSPTYEPAQPVEEASAPPLEEVIDHTEPTPESALDLDPSLGDAPAFPAVLDSVEEAAPLTDSAFGQAVRDFSGSALGSLVEESIPAPQPSAEEAIDFGLEAPETLELIADDDTELPTLDIPAPEPLDELAISFDAVEHEVDPTLTANVFVEEPTAVNSTPLLSDFDLTAPESVESALELIPEDDAEPAPAVEEDSFETMVADEQLTVVEDDPFEAAVADDEATATPPPEPVVTAEPVPPAKPSPASAPPLAGMALPASAAPFLGMERDMGSFMGGMPLSLAPLAAPVAQPAPAAPQPTEQPTQAAPSLHAEEPPELFDESPEKLDELPDALDAIGDVSGALAEPTPPPAEPTPKPTPTLHSLSADPVIATAAAPTSSNVTVPPFTGTRPAVRGRAAPMGGLAGPPVRATDIFSQTAFPPIDEAMFRPQPIEIPPTGAAAFAALKSAPGTTTAASSKPQAAPGRPPAGQSAPASKSSDETEEEEAKRHRRPWWKNIRRLLPLLILVTAGAIALVVIFVPNRGMVQAAIKVQGIDKLSVLGRKEQIRNLRASLVRPDLRNVAIGNLQGQGISPGFVQDPAAMDSLAQAENSPYDEKQGTVVLMRQTADPATDTSRMTAVLLAAYAENRDAADKAWAARIQLENAQKALDTIKAQYDQQQAAVARVADSVKASAGNSASELLLDPQAATEQLDQKNSQLRAASAESRSALDARRARVTELRDKLIAAATEARRGQEAAAQVLDKALAGADPQLAQLAKSAVDAKLVAYIGRAQAALSQVREFLPRQKDNAEASIELHRQLSERRTAGLRRTWAADETLRGLIELRATADAATATDLDQKIDARRVALATGEPADDVRQKLLQAATQVDTDRHQNDQRMAELLGAFTSAPFDAAAAQVASSVDDQMNTAQSALQQYVASIAATQDEPQLRRLESQAADQQALLDVSADAQLSQAARESFDAAQEAESQAAAALAANIELLSSARALKDATAQLTTMADTLKTAQADVTKRTTEVAGIPVVQSPDERSVSVVYGQDQRVWYIVGALLVIAAVFAGPLWLAAHDARPEPAFAQLQDEPSTPRRRIVEEFANAPVDDEEPALIA